MALLVLEAIFRGSGILVMGVLSRALPAAELGVLFVTFAISEVVQVVLSLGTNPIVMRRMASDRETAPTVLGAQLVLRLATTPLFVAIVLAGAAAWTDLPAVLVVGIALVTALDQLFVAESRYLATLDRTGPIVPIGASVQTLFVLGLAAAAWAAPTLPVVIAVYLARSTCLAGLGLAFLRRAAGGIQLGWDGSLVREARPFVLLGLLRGVRDRADTLLLGLLTRLEVVAHYQLADRVVKSPLFVSTSLAQGAFPQLAASGPSRENAGRLLRGTASLALLGTAGALVLALAAEPIAALVFGPLGPEVAPLLRWYGWILPFALVSPYLGSSLVALGQERPVLVAQARVTLAEVLAMAIAIALAGALGAIAVAIAARLTLVACFATLLRGLWQRGSALR